MIRPQWIVLPTNAVDAYEQEVSNDRRGLRLVPCRSLQEQVSPIPRRPSLERQCVQPRPAHGTIGTDGRPPDPPDLGGAGLPQLDLAGVQLDDMHRLAGRQWLSCRRWCCKGPPQLRRVTIDSLAIRVRAPGAPLGA